MIRKLILFGLIAASSAPASLSAAAEPIRSQERKPYMLIMSGKARDAQFTEWIKNLVGSCIDVRENNQNSRRISAAEIADAVCVLYSMDTSKHSSINFEILRNMFPRYRDANGEYGLMGGFFGNPNRAIVMCEQDGCTSGVSRSLHNFFDANINRFFQGDRFILPESRTFITWIQSVANTQRQDILNFGQRDHTSPGIDDTMQRGQQLHKEPSAQAIAGSKEELENAFPVFDNETIIKHIISYLEQENSALIDTMIELIEMRYSDHADSGKIYDICKAVADNVPHNNSHYLGTYVRLERLYNTVFAKK